MLTGLIACGQADKQISASSQAVSPSKTEVVIQTHMPTTTHEHEATITSTATHTVRPTSIPNAISTNTPNPDAAPPATKPPAVFVEAGTPVHTSGAVIDPENANEITELARWGRGVITDIDLSADGRWLAVASGSGVYVHDVADLSIPPQAIGTNLNVSGVSIAPAGEKIALALETEAVQVWQLNPPQLLFEKEKAWEPKFSPAGDAIAVEVAEGADIWDSMNGEEIASYITSYPARSRFSPNGDLIAVWVEIGEIVSIYNWRKDLLISEKEVMIHSEDGEYEEYSPFVSDVDFIQEDELRVLVLEVGTYNIFKTGRIEVQQPADSEILFSAGSIAYLAEATKYVCNEPIFFLEQPEPPSAKQMEVSLDGKIAAIWYEQLGFSGNFGEYSSMRFYQISDGRLLYALEEGIVDFELSPDGQTWVAGLQDGRLQIRQLSDGSVLDSVDFYESPALDLKISPGDHWVGVVYEDEVKVRHAANGKVEYSFPAINIAFSPAGDRFALAYEDGHIEIRDLKDGSLTNALLAHSDRVSAIAFTSNNEILTAGFDCKINLWRIPGVTHIRSFENFMVLGSLSEEQVPVRVSDFLIMPGSQTVIGRFISGDFGIWDIEAGKLNRIPDPDHYGDLVAVGTDGNIFAVPSYYVPQPWDEKVVFVETDAKVASFSPDSQLLATVWHSKYGDQLQIWEVSPSRILNIIELNTGSAPGVSFTHNGKLILTSSLDGIVRLWGVP